MLKCVEEIERIGGGIAIASNKVVINSLPLTIGGIMSNKSLEVVNDKYKQMLKLAHEVLKVNSEIEPFMTLSFIALPVIPELKITDLGLFNVNEFQFNNISI